MRTYRKEGFTLVELLVVIAIIGILASLMFPAISGAIESANSTKVANSGKAIATGIMAENMNREANNDSSIWPGEEFDYLDKSDATKTAPKSYNSADEYFDLLVENKIVEGISGYGPFAGAGVGTPKLGDTLANGQGKYNLWSVVAYLDSSTPGDPPFIFTRNLSLEKGDLKSNDSTDPIWKSKLNGQVKPFGANRCVIVSRGGSATQVRARDLKASRFFGDSKFGTVDNVSYNADADILKALGAAK